jgi:hypothetical protein
MMLIAGSVDAQDGCEVCQTDYDQCMTTCNDSPGDLRCEWRCNDRHTQCVVGAVQSDESFESESCYDSFNVLMCGEVTALCNTRCDTIYSENKACKAGCVAGGLVCLSVQ